MAVALEDFDVCSESFRGMRRQVLVSRTPGPPVIIMHEIFGVTKPVIEFCRTIAAAGYQVWVPVLFGSIEPKAGTLANAARFAQFVCVASEFRIFSANKSGRWADWLRELVAKVCEKSGANRVGVIGLCLTGNFVLAMAQDRRVHAPVMGEPSLPFFRPRELHTSREELDAVKARIADPGDRLVVRGYRYTTDTICSQAKFDRLSEELGCGFIGRSIPANEKLHSVFTDLRDANNNLRHDKVEEVIAFLHERLRSK
jgi:dienelactone hydrolase